MIRKILCIILLFVLPALLGVLITDKNSKRLCSAYNEGNILILFLVTLLWNIGKHFDFRMSQYVVFFLINILILGTISIFQGIRVKGKRDRFSFFNKWNFIMSMGIFLILLFQLQGYFGVSNYEQNDMTVEIVNTMLSNEKFYEINPFTGGEYQMGQNENIYSPLFLFYAILCRIAGMHPSLFIHIIIPFWILVLFASLSVEFGYEFFEDRKKVFYFVLVIQCLNLFGAVGSWLPSYSLLFEAWTAESILVIILLPMLLLQCYRVTGSGRSKKKWSVLIIQIFLIISLEKSGIFYAGIIGIVYILIVLGRKVYEHIRIA